MVIAGETPENGDSVIAPPHPLDGGSMGSPVVPEIAWACAQADLASLTAEVTRCLVVARR